MTTAEKITAMRDHLAAIAPDELPESARDFALNLQIAKGLGFDPFELILPDDPNELDEMIDGAIGLLLNLRGDELPPFDWSRYVPAARAGLSAGDVAEVMRMLAEGRLESAQATIAELHGRLREVPA